MGKIRSRLVTYTVTAKDPDTDKYVQWEIQLQGNRIREDRADWLINANKFFSDIKLTKVTPANKRRETTIKTKAEIAAEGLKILDSIIAGRKAQA